MTPYAVVIPTLVPGTLADCLAAFAAATGPRPEETVLVDDRTDREPGPLQHPLSVLGDLRERTAVLGGGGRGLATMPATSALIPPTATWHRLAGARRHRHTPAWQEEATP